MNKSNPNRARRTATALSSVASRIMTYTLEGLVPEVEPLFTALYLSPPEETLEIFNRYPGNSEIRYIVGEVNLYHSDMALLAKAVSAGFFNYEVDYLLEIAKKNGIAAARFVPIFCTALEHAAELGLSDQLQRELEDHIDRQKQKDGFAIISTANRTLTLYFAKDVIPA